MRITQSITASTRTEWRRWLKKNHTTASNIWIIFPKRHTGRKCVEYGDAVEEALCFGWIDGTIQAIDADSYGRRFTPRRTGSQWSELNRRRARKMIAEGKMTEAGMGLFRAADKEARSRAVGESEGPVPVPEFLKQALKKMTRGWEKFEQLPAGYKKMAVRWIVAAKRDETRVRRVDEFVRLTAAGKHLGMK